MTNQFDAVTVRQDYVALGAELPEPPPPDTPEQTDQKFTQVFTDTGSVIGANGQRLKDYRTGELQDNHFQFANGVVHTIHVVGKDAGVFIPQGFTDVKITSKDTVVARNPKTGEVLMIAHVQVGEGKSGKALLKKNMKTIRENGTMYIGKTGGKGGEGAPAVGIGLPALPHSHIQYHPSESHRIQAYNKTVLDRKALGSTSDFTQKGYSSHVSDFRNFVK